MIPEGLVLLTSATFIVSVVKLANHDTLIQQLSATEVLARVDVLCVDKTGTITEGKLKLVDVKQVGKENKEEILEVSGLFIYIGYEPNIAYLKDFAIFDNEGYIKVNEKYETEIPGLYAVGDNIKKDYYQIITAMSEGTLAALNVAISLNGTN